MGADEELGRTADPATLAFADGFEGHKAITPRLDFDENDQATPPGNNVDLAHGRAVTPRKYPPATKPQMPSAQ